MSTIMQAQLVKFHEYLTTMAHGAFVRLRIGEFEDNVFLSADSGAFCPYSDDPSIVLSSGMKIDVTALVEDNCDRFVCERNPKEPDGVYGAEKIYSGGGKVEKIVVGQIKQIDRSGEITLIVGPLIVTHEPQSTEKLAIGDRVKVVGDLVFLPQSSTLS